MTDLIARTRESLPDVFDPRILEARETVSVLDAAIDHAKRLKDWPALEKAIEKKLNEVRAVVDWWDANVGVRESPGRGGIKSITDRLSIPADKAQEATGISPMQVSRWRKALSKPDAYRGKVFGAAYAKVWGGDTIALKHTGDQESYTPGKYIESARRVLGGIDLDPASNHTAQRVVKASTYYTADDDGLQQNWRGRVWMNPPYTALVINKFLEKLAGSYLRGDVTAAIALTNNNTDTTWFHSTAQVAGAVCFTRGRINFCKPDGSLSSPTNGQCFFYLGGDVAAFADEFAQHGMVMVRA